MGNVRLYNLKNDLGEQDNLAPANTAKLDELLNDLLAWRKSVDVPDGEIKENPKYKARKK